MKQDHVTRFNLALLSIACGFPLGLLRLQDLVRSPPTSKMEVHIRQGTVNTYRQVLREIKQRDINNIISSTRGRSTSTFSSEP
jgi:ionotropic glutamate receptor